ncbi:NAD(P)H-binding protein [Brucella tritici]|uniref:NAD(P)H-binding protein n=1 Tax=Brucella tritici TaxID=94626 RepID=A0A833CIR3_9HYPH|nr:NAD(P)H-binding protein [Brucella tritici]KAB2662691.1 NAD(P)H-binding protein [Brucella tritici]
MFAIVGAAGKVGYSTSLALRKAGFPVRAILRDPAKAKPLADIGCEIALADLQDSEALAEAIANVDATQVILPPSSQTKDTVREMQRAIESLVAALEQTRSKRVLAISDYGAHVASDIGMPSMFRMFEARLSLTEGQKLILRSAEHMEGWARFAPTAIASGILPSFHDPIDKTLPMISAHDLGRIAASLLLEPGMRNDLRIVHAEGPRRYRPIDVAEALSQLSGIPIEAQAVPRSLRKVSLERIMSESASELLFKVYDAHTKGGLIDVEANASEIRRGTTQLVDALRPLIPPG